MLRDVYHNLGMPMLAFAGVLGVSILVSAQAQRVGSYAKTKAKEAKHEEKAIKVETAGQKYKNIQVLRDLPAAELMPTMQSYNRELSVKCEFCHVTNAFEKDENPNKEMSRDMIRIVQDLNAPSSATHRPRPFNSKANCFLCHHGHPEAITTTPK